MVTAQSTISDSVVTRNSSCFNKLNVSKENSSITESNVLPNLSENSEKTINKLPTDIKSQESLVENARRVSERSNKGQISRLRVNFDNKTYDT